MARRSQWSIHDYSLLGNIPSSDICNLGRSATNASSSASTCNAAPITTRLPRWKHDANNTRTSADADHNANS